MCRIYRVIWCYPLTEKKLTLNVPIYDLLNIMWFYLIGIKKRNLGKIKTIQENLKAHVSASLKFNDALTDR